MKTYRARTVVTMDGPPIDDGAVAITGDRIAAVGRFAEIDTRERRRDGSRARWSLLPGLINAHCHLDFTSLRGVIPPQRSFADWIRQINGLRRELSEERLSRVDRAGIRGSQTLGHDRDRECRVRPGAAGTNGAAAFADMVVCRADRRATATVCRGHDRERTRRFSGARRDGWADLG